MNIEDYREYCLSVKGATECMPFDEHTLVFKVMDKMFTFATLRPKNGRFWADMKCNPDKSEELIEQYEDIFWGPFSPLGRGSYKEVTQEKTRGIQEHDLGFEK